MADSDFIFYGNLLCLDFINTEVVKDGCVVDLIGSAADFYRWTEAAATMQPDAGERRVTRATDAAPAISLERVRVFRAELRQMADDIAAGSAVRDSALAAINAILHEHRAFAALERSDGRVERVMHYERTSETDLLAPVAESAAELLTRLETSRLRRCENPSCILYFYDISRNQKRRWCSMSGCGNRSKVSAHYHRGREKRRSAQEPPMTEE